MALCKKILNLAVDDLRSAKLVSSSYVRYIYIRNLSAFNVVFKDVAGHLII